MELNLSKTTVELNLSKTTVELNLSKTTVQLDVLLYVSPNSIIFHIYDYIFMTIYSKTQYKDYRYRIVCQDINLNSSADNLDVPWSHFSQLTQSSVTLNLVQVFSLTIVN
jgi:hypothetical protein